MNATIGFKDWALVCEAMGRGRQSIILRKGGLAEGRLGFQFRHQEFFLFPTQYHEQAQKIRPEELRKLEQSGPCSTEVSDETEKGSHPDFIEIRYAFRLEWSGWIDDVQTLERLVPFHIYTDEVARERFAYDETRSGAGLTIAVGRVMKLNRPWVFPDAPAYGGCRSWIEKLLSLPGDLSLTPVLSDDEHAERLREIEFCLRSKVFTAE